MEKNDVLPLLHAQIASRHSHAVRSRGNDRDAARVGRAHETCETPADFVGLGKEIAGTDARRHPFPKHPLDTRLFSDPRQRTQVGTVQIPNIIGKAEFFPLALELIYFHRIQNLTFGAGVGVGLGIVGRLARQRVASTAVFTVLGNASAEIRSVQQFVQQ